MSSAPPQPGMTSAGPPPERRTVAAVIAISVLILLTGAAVASLLMLDRDAGPGDPGSPEEVVRDYFAAADRDDCETMVAMISEVKVRYSSARTRGEALDMCTERAEAFTDPIEIVSTEVVEAEEDEDYAIVSVELEVGGDPDEHEVWLYLEDGAWRLYDSEVFDET
jgi:hypothetical protein